MVSLGQHLCPLFVLVLSASLSSFVVAFVPSIHQSRSSSTHPARLKNLYAAPKKSKSSLEKLLNVFESAQASVQDFLFMRPSRPIPPSMRRLLRIQFIAALGDPKASSGTNARDWGIWTVDPGPRGVYLGQYNNKAKTAPAGWKFDANEFWIEEYGRIMEKPSFPIPPGKYLVTGGRAMTTILTIDPMNGEGQQCWTLQDGTLYDVTHLPCRAAKYNAVAGSNASPINAKVSDFPVTPGATMPQVEGCDKQDYAVVFVVAVEDD